MSLLKLDGRMLAQMIQAGAVHLANNAEKIDALNVFPVPDGDTGTNMNLSMTSGAREVRQTDSDNVSVIARAFSKGLLMGARGNSGVILSQIFRGFAKGLEDLDTADAGQLAKALETGVETAYKAVMKPVEGTILTVAKEAAEKAADHAAGAKDLAEFMDLVLCDAKASLKRTPDLLPVLKEVGVVDSGGQGLVTIYEGFSAVLKGEALPDEINSGPDLEDMVKAEHHKIAQDFMRPEDIEYGYCTEFMVKFDEDKLKQYPYLENDFRDELAKQGDSLLVVSDEDIVKVHVHTEYPGKAMTLGQNYGSLINIKVENMREQHSAIVNDQKQHEKPEEKSAYGIVAIAMGKGISNLFESLGAAVIIEGGQTMNPSTQDITEAIERVNAEQVMILPNNKNIVMAAEQAAAISDSKVKVIPAKTIPQGISALLAFNPDQSVEHNAEAMSAAADHVKTGQVTFAVRDTTMEGISIRSGQFMGLADGKIVSVQDGKIAAAEELLSTMIGEDDEILTIIYGEDATLEEAEQLAAFAETAAPDLEVELHEGNQPIYSYIFAVE